MRLPERLLNFGFGLSLIAWGLIGFLEHYESFQQSYLRIFITLLNLSVGLLILFRSPVIKQGSLLSILLSIPSLICGGLLFKFAKPLSTWSIPFSILFIIGGIIAFIAFLNLGKSFSVFPGLRPIVTNGLFGYIRHPSYLGESLMLTACLFQTSSLFTIIPFLLFVPSIIIRIWEEEKLLTTHILYQAYAKQVKWRLIPGIW